MKIPNSKFQIPKMDISINGKKILDNISLTLEPGKLVVLLGRNGSGKSTLAMEILKRSKMDGSVFLGFQQPVCVPGVNYNEFLKMASKTKLGPLEFYQSLKVTAKILEIPEDFLTRDLNDNLSGGEKKKMELFQALILQPKFAVLDEPDSGVDTYSLDLVAKAIKHLLKSGTGVLLITHNQKLLEKLPVARTLNLKNGILC